MQHHHSGEYVQVTASLSPDRLKTAEDASGVWTVITTYVCSLTQLCSMEVLDFPGRPEVKLKPRKN